jgi:hypothetical protein
LKKTLNFGDLKQESALRVSLDLSNRQKKSKKKKDVARVLPSRSHGSVLAGGPASDQCSATTANRIRLV